MLDGDTEAMNEPQQNELMCEVLADGSMMRWNHGWFKPNRRIGYGNAEMAQGRPNGVQGKPQIRHFFRLDPFSFVR